MSQKRKRKEKKKIELYVVMYQGYIMRFLKEKER